MDERKYFKKMEKHNIIAHKNKCLYQAETFGNLVSSLLFVLFLLPIMARLFILSGGFGETFIASDKVRGIIVSVSKFLPYLNADLEFWEFLIYTVIYLFIIPIIAGLTVYFVTKIIALKSSPTPLSDNLDKNIKHFKKNYLKYGSTANVLPLDFDYDVFNPFVIFVSLLTVLLSLASLSIWDTITYYIDEVKYPDIATLVMGIFFAGLIRVGGIIICFGIFTSLVSGLFYGIQKTTIFTRGRYWEYRKALGEIEELEKDIENERKAEKEAKEQAEKAAAETKAENEFIKINIDGKEDVSFIRTLADKGSPSASLYMAKKLYFKYLNESLTNSEKKDLTDEIIEYLENISASENIEADFLLLSIRVKSESNNLETWQQYLNQARKIRNSEKLPSEYKNDIEELINTLIETINDLEDHKTTFTIDYASLQARTNETLRNMYGGAAIVGSDSDSDKIWDDIEGMRITNNNIDKINDSNYDVAGFPDSSDIW